MLASNGRNKMFETKTAKSFLNPFMPELKMFSDFI